MTKLERIRETAKGMLRVQTIEELVITYETTEGKTTRETAEIRDWIMDILEEKNEEAFYNWIDDEYTDSPRKYFLKK